MELIAPTTARAVADHWTGRAERFEQAASHNRHETAWRDVMRAALGQGPADLVDLGTGTGACAIIAAELGHRVRAVDGSAGMLAVARKAAARRGVEIEFIEATMDEAALAPASADLVTMRNVLWTLERPRAAIALARRILRPGGRLLISDGLWSPAGERRDGTPPGVDLPLADGLSEATGRDLLLAGGFTGIEAWQHLFPNHPYDGMGCPDFFLLTGTRTD